MFESIEIKNFKGIKNLTLNNLKGINLIIGKNSTLKSTILESLFINCLPTSAEQLFKVNSQRDHNIISSDIFKSFFYKLNIKENIYFKVIHKNTHEHSINISYENIPDSPLSAILNMRFMFKFKNLILENKAVFHNNKAMFYSSPNNEASTPCFIYSGNKIEIKLALENIIRRKETEKFIKILRTIDPSIKNVFLGDNGIAYIDTGLEQFIPLNYFGNMFIAFFNIILYIMYLPHGIVLIDGFDFISQEYRDIIWTHILKLAVENKTQLFITSINPDLYKSIMLISSKNNNTNELKVLKVDKKQDDITISVLK